MDNFAKGKAEGMVEGKAEGKMEGQVEGKLEVAKKLILLGVPLEIVMESTGLTREEVEVIKAG